MTEHEKKIVEKDFSYLSLYKTGVSNVDFKIFEKIKGQFDKKPKNQININSFFKSIFPLFKRKGVERFFAIKENSNKKITLAYVKSLTELYYFTYLINRIYRNMNYSAEEAVFLFFEKMWIRDDIKSYLKNEYDLPVDYLFNIIFKDICKNSLYIIDYLKEIGFNEKPRGITFYEILKKYGNSKDYNFFIPSIIKNKKIHDEVERVVKNMKKDLFREEKDRKFSRPTKFIRTFKRTGRKTREDLKLKFENINNEKDSFMYFDLYDLFLDK